MTSIIDIYKKNKEILQTHNLYTSCIDHLSKFVQNHDAIDLFNFITKIMDGWKMAKLSVIQYDNVDEFILGFIFFLKEEDEFLQKYEWDAEDRRYLQTIVHFISHLLCDDTVAVHLSSSRRR